MLLQFVFLLDNTWPNMVKFYCLIKEKMFSSFIKHIEITNLTYTGVPIDQEAMHLRVKVQSYLFADGSPIFLDGFFRKKVENLRHKLYLV